MRRFVSVCGLLVALVACGGGGGGSSVPTGGGVTATPGFAASLTTTWFAPPPLVGGCGGGGLATAIVAAPDGNLWIAFPGGGAPGDCIIKLSTAGAFTFYQLPGALHRSVFNLTVGPDNAVWFTETAGNLIGRIDTSGNITEYAAPNHGEAIVTGSDGNLWYASGAAIYGFSPISHTIVGTVSSIPSGTGIVQLLSDPATGAIVVESVDANNVASISRFAPSPSPSVTTFYTASSGSSIGTLSLGGSNIYGMVAPPSNAAPSALLVFSQSSYAQSSIPLPAALTIQGSQLQTHFETPIAVAANGDFFLPDGCSYNGCDSTYFDVAQLTSGGILVGQGPQIFHQRAVGESRVYVGGTIGSDGNAWFLFVDGMALSTSVERVTPNAH